VAVMATVKPIKREKPADRVAFFEHETSSR
jgi:hypothetical protein